MTRRARIAAVAAAAILLLGTAACSSVPVLNVIWLPDAPGALAPGSPAPALSLPSAQGETVTLEALQQGGRAAVIVFYRGHW